MTATTDPVATILLIDDDAAAVEPLRTAFAEDGYQVGLAQSGAQALKLAREIRFDLAICDLKLEGLGGEDTLAGLKAIDPDLEVVIGTAQASVETAIECMRRGAYDYVAKPYDVASMRRLVARALEHSRVHGAVELYEASRALVEAGPSGLARVHVLAQRVLRADAAALIRVEDGELLVTPSNPSTGPSDALMKELARRAMQTPAPFRFVSPRADGVPTTPADDLFAAGLVCPLRAAGNVEGALVLLRRQGSAPFTVAVVRRATTFAALCALAVANARVDGGARAVPEAVQRLLREGRAGVEGLRDGANEDVLLRLRKLETIFVALEKMLRG